MKSIISNILMIRNVCLRYLTNWSLIHVFGKKGEITASVDTNCFTNVKICMNEVSL